MSINLQRRDSEWKKPYAQGFSTPGLHLRPIKDSDLPAVTDILMDPDLYDYVSDLDSPEDGIGWFASVLGKRDYLFLAVCDRDTQAVLGLTMINACPDKTLRIGGFFAPGKRDRGYATEVIRGIRTLNGPDPLFADIHHRHARAVRLMEKTGCIATGRRIGDSIEFRI